MVVEKFMDRGKKMEEKPKKIVSVLAIAFVLVFGTIVPGMMVFGRSESFEEGDIVVLAYVDSDDEVKELSEYGEIIDHYGRNVLIQTTEKGEEELKAEHRTRSLDHRNELRVKGHEIDTNEGLPEIQEDLKIDDYEPGTEGIYLVDLIGPVNPEWREKIEEKGVDIINYVPNYAYEVRMTPEQSEEVEDLFFVDWVGVYQPEFKLAENLEPGLVELKLVEDVGRETFNQISFNAEFLSLNDLSGGRASLTAEVHSEKDLVELAHMSEVYYISNPTENKLHDEVATQIIGGGAWIWDPDDDPPNPWRGHDDEFEYGAHVNHLGWTGDGEVVAVADSGINPDHLDFQDRVIGGYYWEGDTWEDDDGHGTHVAGSVAGDTYNGTETTIDMFGGVEELGPYYAAQGPAYDSELFSVKIFDSDGWIGPDDYFDIVAAANNNSEAYIHSNSWGISVDEDSEHLLGQYLDRSEAYDEAVRDSNRSSDINEPMVIVVAAGNDGDWAGYNSVGDPATAKNVISVGSTENFMPDEEVDNPDNISDFSSRGWTDDYRVKPDVVAPGEEVFSTYYDVNDGYLQMSGTSMAAPAVSGAASLVVEWYEDKFGEKPSPAMVRALLINTAYDLDDEHGNTGPIPNRDEGWGMVNLPMVMDAPVDFMLEDQTSVLETGQIEEYEIQYQDPNKPLKISTVWTDAAAASESDPALINDLNLEVETPTGEIIRGNAFDLSGDGVSDDGFTYPNAEVLDAFDGDGDGWDDRNNVQNVYIHQDELESGTYTVRVKGENIGDPVVDDGQDYALTMYNAAPEGEEPSIDLTRPKGEEVWQAGTEEDIKWDAQGVDDPVDHINLYYSIDGTDSWETIATEVEDTESYTWTIPEEDSEESHVRAVAVDEVGRTGEDTSDAFTIEGEPPEPSYFEVSITEFDDRIVEGETATVNYTVENTGEEEDTQGIDFTIYHRDEVIYEDGESITLLPEETYEGNFTWQTEVGDAEDRYEVEVASEDDEDDRSLTVLKADAFNVQVRLEEREIVEGEEALMNYTIINTGNQETQDIEFTVKDREEEEIVHEYVEEDVTVPAQGEYEGNFTWQTEEGDATDRPYILEVASEDDEDDSGLTVLKADAFNVQVSLEEREIVEGEEAFLNYTIINTKDEDSTQDIEFTIEDSEGEKVYEDLEEDVTVPASEEYEGNFTWQTEEGDAADRRYSLEVASEDDKDDSRLTVLRSGFLVEVDLEEGEIAEGEEAVMNYEILNTGDQETQDIEFTVKHQREDEIVYDDVKEDLTLKEGESYEGSFVWQTEEGDASDRSYSLEVASEDDKDDSRLTVLKANAFTVQVDLEEREIVEGEEAVMNYEILNTRDEEDTQDIKFTVQDPSPREDKIIHEKVEKDVTISAGQEHEGNFTWQTEEGDATDRWYSLEVASDDDEDGTPLEVLKVNAFTVQVRLEEREIVEGEEAVLNYEILNTKDDPDTQDIDFIVEDSEGEIVYDDVKEDLSLDEGESYESEFTWKAEDAGYYDLTVASEDDEKTESLTVRSEEATFIVEITGPEGGEEFEEGANVTIYYRVENIGLDKGNQDIVLRVDGEEIDTKKVDLDAGEDERDDFTWEGEDEGSYNLTIMSEDDEDTVTITLVVPFEIDITSYDEAILEGEELLIEYEVTNPGEIERTETIKFNEVGGQEIDKEKNITVGATETYEGNFTWTGEDTGEYTFEVRSERDGDSVRVSVYAEGQLKVEILDYETEMEKGEGVQIEYRVENTGDMFVRQEIEFFVYRLSENGEDNHELVMKTQTSEDDVVFNHTENILLDPGNDTERGFTLKIEEEGDYELSVKGVELERSVSIQEEISISVVESDVETFDFTIEIDGEGTVIVEWKAEDETVTDEETFGITEETEVNLVAEADDDWEFEEWHGTDETGEEITITMDEDKTITAVFEEEEEEDEEDEEVEIDMMMIAGIIVIIIILVIIGYMMKRGGPEPDTVIEEEPVYEEEPMTEEEVFEEPEEEL